MKTRAFWAILAGVLLVPSSRSAEPEWPVPRGASSEPSPYVYDPAVWKNVPREFLDDATACVLYAATSHQLDDDGTVTSTTHEITRLNSRKSIEKLGENRDLSYKPAYQQPTLNIARIHKPGGKIVEVEPRHVHLRDVGTDYQVYDAGRQLIISFPSLEVGDVLEIKWTLRGKNPEHLGQFFARYSFGDPENPIFLDELRVRIPKAKTLKHASVVQKVEPKITETDKDRLYVWRMTPCPQLARDDDRPSREELRPAVVCSTFASWDEVAAWKRKMRAECWECTAEIKKVVAEVTRGLKTQEEKARALTYWVRRNVRYISAGSTHDYTPHKPGDVLANRHGDCKDTSQLLAVMFKEAGLPAQLVTLGFRDDGQILEEVPSPWGTHGILLSRIDGKDHWIDTTASLAAWDFLSSSCRDRMCYITDDQWIILKKTPPMTADDNRFETTTEIVITADGTSRVLRKEAYFGLAATNQRDRWLEVPAGEQRRLVAEKLLDSNNQSRLVRLTLDDAALRNFDQPVRAEIEYHIPRQFSSKDRDASFTDSRVWSYLLAYHIDPDRQSALELSSPMESKHTYLFYAPAGFEFDGLPKTRVVKGKWGSFLRTVTWKGEGYRGLRVDFHLRLESARINPKDFAAFQDFHKEVSDAYRVWVTLERVWDRKHIPEMEAALAKIPDDAAAAAVLVEQYLHHGDRESAQRVLRKALAAKPEDRRLVELGVKAAASGEEAEKAQRELVRRHPEDPVHAIALGAMLIDRGKHELAEPVLNALALSAPPAARALAEYQLARSAFELGNYLPALEHLDKAAAFDNKPIHMLLVEQLRGRIFEKLERPGDAIKAYQRAHKLDPKSETVLLTLLELALTRGEKSVAQDHLRRYIVLVEGKLSGLNRAAEMALRLGWQQEAHDLALHARDLGFSAATQSLLGLIHLQRGEPDKAVFHLERAEPTSAVMEGLIRAHLAMGNLQAAELQARKAGALPIISEELKQALMRVATLARQRDASLARLSDAVERDRATASLGYLVCAEELRAQKRAPARVEAMVAMAAQDIGPVLAFRGLLALERGQLGESLKLADQAVRASPGDWRGWYVRGRVRVERLALGGLADLEKAAELSGFRDADVLRSLAEAQHQSGHKEAAMKSLRKAMELRKDDKTLAELWRAWNGS